VTPQGDLTVNSASTLPPPNNEECTVTAGSPQPLTGFLPPTGASIAVQGGLWSQRCTIAGIGTADDSSIRISDTLNRR
jgi:hypothetical protein